MSTHAVARPAGGLHPFRGVWRLADPKVTLASVASMILAVGYRFVAVGFAGG